MVLLLVGGSACAPPVDRAWHEASGYRWRALADPGNGSPGFASIDAATSRVVHRNDVNDEAALANRHLLLGAGVAIGDIDGDDRPDLAFATTAGALHLYRNDGDLRFTDVTASAGVRAGEAPATGMVLVDVDGDSDRDLLVGTLAGPLQLWQNDGRGRFTDVSTASGLPSGAAVTTITLADVDGDGDLDLYAATYKRRTALDAYPPQDRAFDQVVKKVNGRYVVEPQWQAEYRVEDRPDLGGVVRSQRAEPDLFLLNDGRGQFTAVPIAGERFTDAAGAPLAAPPDFFTLAARFYDVTGDGAPDLYACNDFEDPDQFWRNDGRGNFQLFPAEALRATSNTCMSVEFGDVDRDGVVDLFTADMLAPTREMRQRQIPTHTPLPKGLGEPRDRPQWMRNMLHRGRGDGTWAEVGEQAGVTATDWTWGSLFLDVDLDGFEDLLAANGHRWDIREADVYDAIRDRFPRVAWNREQGEFPPDTAHLVARRNRGDLTFEDARTRWRFGERAGVQHAIASGDLDGDGDLDVVVTRLNDTPLLYRNEGVAGRVLVSLQGTAANRDGIGARVTVEAAGLPVQTREVTAGGLYLASAAPELAFATGEATGLSITVRWRDGRVSRLVDLLPGREYRIDASGAVSAPPPAAPPAPLFEDATALLGGEVHRDSLFDDFARQPLMPGRLSALGPGVSWVDLDGDGQEEIVVGGGRTGAVRVLRWQGERYQLDRQWPAAFDVTTALPVPEVSGGMALVVGQSSYEAATPAAALAVPGAVMLSGGAPDVILSGGAPDVILSGGAQRRSRRISPSATPRSFDSAAFGRSAQDDGSRAAFGRSAQDDGSRAAFCRSAQDDALVTPDTGSVGPLALADINGDGRPDLFIGARVRAGAWPLPAPSRLLLRTADGGWVPDTTNAAALRALGLVSAATFTDIDGDGDADLVVVGEYGPVRVLRNRLGALSDVTAALGLSGMTSRWNGIAAGDLDGDGRLDLIATSYGLNTPWQASPARPHVLHLGDFGASLPGLVFARADTEQGVEYPLEPLPRLAFAIGDVRDRMESFRAFSAASVAQLLGARAPTAVRIGATTYEHTVLLNRGDRFEVRPLPAMAQTAPAFGIVVADFDGDGHEDLFLAQNFSSTSIDTPRLDAGQGLMLLGTGAGDFRPLSVPAAGISALGDQRGAATADYDADGRPDLLLGQHAAPVRLWRNARGRPGVRVRLAGPANNPLGIGVRLSVVAADGREGPMREIAAGSGYWSMSSPTVVLARPATARVVRVRWPGGPTQDVPLGEGLTTVVRAP
jgi:enediyne biosynthesis protein E4